MFGIGFWEFVLIIALVLLVLGPEKIGPIMRTLGKAMREIQRNVFEMKQALKIDERMEELDEVQRDVAREIRKDGSDIEQSMKRHLEGGKSEEADAAGSGGEKSEKTSDKKPRWDELHDGKDGEEAPEGGKKDE
ncbi:MAG: twin-arginine translocase TatA/TatE family subunit [Pseudomonadota bacterium]